MLFLVGFICLEADIPKSFALLIASVTTKAAEQTTTEGRTVLVHCGMRDNFSTCSLSCRLWIRLHARSCIFFYHSPLGTLGRLHSGLVGSSGGCTLLLSRCRLSTPASRLLICTHLIAALWYFRRNRGSWLNRRHMSLSVGTVTMLLGTPASRFPAIIRSRTIIATRRKTWSIIHYITATWGIGIPPSHSGAEWIGGVKPPETGPEHCICSNSKNGANDKNQVSVHFDEKRMKEKNVKRKSCIKLQRAANECRCVCRNNAFVRTIVWITQISICCAFEWILDLSVMNHVLKSYRSVRLGARYWTVVFLDSRIFFRCSIFFGCQKWIFNYR